MEEAGSSWGWREGNTVMVEAEDLIHQWLQGVENSREKQSHDPILESRDPHMPAYAWGATPTVHTRPQRWEEHIPEEWAGQHMSLGGSGFQLATPTLRGQGDQPDFLTALDWSEGDVRANAKAVVDGLMTKTLAKVGHTKGSHDSKKRSHDPLVTMEMRHEAVKERRREKNQRKLHALRSRLAEREARREAELVVRREEEERRRTEGREEQLVKEQMAAIRKQMREEKARQRLLESHMSSVGGANPFSPPPVMNTSDHEAVMRFAGECVRESEVQQRRAESRVELVRQLQEAEREEEREKLRLLRQVFTNWYSVVAQERAKLGKAQAVREWRLMVRVWSGWRGVVRQGKARREREAVAREMQREKRCIDLAVRHHHHRLMLRCLSSWLHEVRVTKARREEERGGERKREKMAAFLQAAVEGKVGVVKGLSDSPETRRMEDAKMAATSENRGKKRKEGPSVGHVTTKGPPEPIIWQAARQQLDQLLEGQGRSADTELEQCDVELTKVEGEREDKAPTTGGGREQSDPPGQPTAAVLPAERGPEIRERVAVKRLPWRPPTKPASLIKMEERSAEIAQRRAAREARRLQQESERLAEMERREEERKRAEREAREQLAARRREERKLAKQREEDRQERLQRMAELTATAKDHYHKVLLRTRGLKPWQHFILVMREQRLRAEDSNHLRLLRMAFRPWKAAREERERGREEVAANYYHSLLLKTSIRSWKEYILYCHRLDEVATHHCQWLMVHRAFRGWEGITRAERVRGWEEARRAKTFHQRLVKQRALRAWVRFVPLAKQERVREGRRDELRRKVAAWLPDYQPTRVEET